MSCAQRSTHDQPHPSREAREYIDKFTTIDIAEKKLLDWIVQNVLISYHLSLERCDPFQRLLCFWKNCGYHVDRTCCTAIHNPVSSSYSVDCSVVIICVASKY